MAKRPIRQVQDLSEETRRVLDVLNDGSDLACVLIAASFLDECLRSLLQRRFVECDVATALLDPVQGALSSFATRADLAYCLGLIGRRSHDDLRMIGRIRNEFAHSHLEMTFGAERIVALANQLKWCDILSVTGLFAKVPNPTKEQIRSSARSRFQVTVALLSQDLLLAGLARPCGRSWRKPRC